ncbi:TPA: aspartate aminotransferase family protein [archaeon]|uniref:Aspartate aminotransferase family protein n=1 Tax=Candidatus Naiadarchaeum limnaeum TaxID=2756139 RepID=A0A832XLW2_9ARCH|nr:aspartate aminotransferase family protein [Candidatus Naiadarchaeum limnaeum]
MKKAQKILSESKKYRIDVGLSNLAAVKGEGCYLIDVDGKKYLDFHSNVSTNNIGYGNPEVKEVVREYSKKGIYKVDGTLTILEEALVLAKKLSKHLPKNLRKSFFVNSGAEAVENAMKLAYLKKGPLGGVSVKGAFHGRTIGVLSYTSSKAIQKKFFPVLPHHELDFCGEKGYCNFRELEDLISRELTPAFVIIECVQGEGGYRPLSKEFVKYLRKITKEHDIAFIIDEVQAGMGRTGKWWAFEHYNVVPDIMATGKSLQVGATIAGKKYDMAKQERGALGSTWGGGHVIDLAVGAKVIEIIEKKNLVKNAERMGDYMLKHFKEIQLKYPRKIIDVRGKGLMIGVEIDSVKRRKKIIDGAFKNGLLLLGCGEKTIRIAPPLIIDGETADKGIEMIEKLIKKY